jgi:hypothetical protein
MYFCTYFSLCSSHIIWIHYLLVAYGLSVIVYLYFIIFCFTAGAYINDIFPLLRNWSQALMHLRSLGSMQTRILLFAFLAMTRLCTQAVGSFFFSITPNFSIRHNPSSSGFRRAIGTLRGGCTTGMDTGSILIWYWTSLISPRPSKIKILQQYFHLQLYIQKYMSTNNM